MTHKQHLIAFVSGGLFAAGLVISGMTMPSKVVGFLDVTGTWDPSLAFVMIGAIAVNFVVHKLSNRRAQPFFGDRFFRPTATDFTPSLVIGSAMFGVGWGFAGYCPGPGIVSSAATSQAMIFVAAMVVGMAAHKLYEKARETTPAPVGAEPTLGR